MKKVKKEGNSILFSRKGELVRLTPCGKNAIRFQGFPDCRVIDEDYNLMTNKINKMLKISTLVDKWNLDKNVARNLRFT